MQNYFFQQFEQFRPEWIIPVVSVGAVFALLLLRSSGSVVRTVAAGALGFYLTTLVFLLLFARDVSSEREWHGLIPFWSYSSIAQGSYTMLYEVILNVVMMIPVGLLIPVVFNNIALIRLALLGAAASALIEVIQLITMRGLFEFDDILHNTLGLVIGYLLYRCVVCVRLPIKNKSVLKVKK